MRAFPAIVLEQPCFKISSYARVMQGFVDCANEDVNVIEALHWLACQAVVFGAPEGKFEKS